MVSELPLPSEILHDYSVDIQGSEVFEHFSFGGVIRAYGVVRTIEQLIAVVRSAISHGIEFRIVGQGHSLLLPEDGYDGLLIKNETRNFQIVSDSSQVIVDSGMSLRTLVSQLAAAGYGGLIHLLPLGGTVGGALVTNCHVEGKNLIDLVRSVTVMMPPTKAKPEVRLVRFQASWLRGSRQTPGTRILDAIRAGTLSPIIVSAQIQLTSLRHDELERQLRVATQQLDQQGWSGRNTLLRQLVTRSDGEAVMTSDLSDSGEIEKKYAVQLSKSGILQLVSQRRTVFRKSPPVTTTDLVALEKELADLVGKDTLPAHELLQ